MPGFILGWRVPQTNTLQVELVVGELISSLTRSALRLEAGTVFRRMNQKARHESRSERSVEVVLR